MPPVNELRSRVDFIYQNELLETNPDKFWKNVGKKRNGQLESFVGKHKAMEEAVAQIVSPNDPPEVKLRKIYDRVQQIRNKSYELQKTEQEEKRDKEKPSRTSKTSGNAVTATACNSPGSISPWSAPPALKPTDAGSPTGVSISLIPRPWSPRS